MRVISTIISNINYTIIAMEAVVRRFRISTNSNELTRYTYYIYRAYVRICILYYIYIVFK